MLKKEPRKEQVTCKKGHSVLYTLDALEKGFCRECGEPLPAKALEEVLTNLRSRASDLKLRGFRK
jgi:transcription initiation factor IIE alpha subunit